MNDTLQKVRKNVALLTRNVSLNTASKQVNNILFVKGDANYSDLRNSFSLPNNTIDSIILMGGDLIIDADVLEPVVKKNPKGIIVLKNES